MTAVLDNRKYEGSGSQLDRGSVARDWNGPIAAGAHLYRGQLVGQLFTDTSLTPAINNWVAGGTMRCLGFCSGEVDNSVGGSLGARAMRAVAQTGQLIDKNAGGANAFNGADLFKPAYGVDNQTCSKLASDGDLIGMLTGFDRDSGLPVVLVDPFLIRMMLAATLGLYPGAGAVLAITANAIAPTAIVHHVGAGVLQTITPPAVILPGATLDVIPDAAFTYNGSGNIKLPGGGGTATVNRAMTFMWDGSFWYPSY